MDLLRDCPDLSSLLRRELAGVATVTQPVSTRAIQRVAASLGAPLTVANLFAVPTPLSVDAYLAYLTARLDEFAPRQEEHDAGYDPDEPPVGGLPVASTLEEMVSQLSQWQQDNPAAVARTPPPPERDDQDSEPEAEDAGEEAAPATTEESPEALCLRLLGDAKALDEWARELYSQVNPLGRVTVEMTAIQPLLDHLVVERRFEVSRLRTIVSALTSNEFAAIRDLNYVRFCVFVRYVLQRYDA